MSFNNDGKYYKCTMNNESVKKNAGFNKISRASINSNEKINLPNKKHNYDENNSINNNLKKDKHMLVKNNTQNISINFTNKKDSLFSKTTKYLNNIKEFNSEYKIEEEKRKMIDDIDNLHKSEMKDTKKKESSNYFTNDKITGKYLHSRENKSFDILHEKRSNEIYIKPINKKYMNSCEKKKKRSYEELNDKIDKVYSHNSNKKSSERYNSVNKKSHERKRYKNSPEIYNKRMNSRREKKIETFEKSPCKLDNKKETINNSENSERFLKEKKKSLDYRESKFADEKYDKHKEKYNKGNFELNEKNKSCKTLKYPNYKYIDNDKAANHKDIKIGKDVINKKYIHKDNTNAYVNEDEKYSEEKKEKKESYYNINDKKNIQTYPKNFNENDEPCKSKKYYEVCRDSKEIEEKSLQKKSSLKDDNKSKRKIENINENIGEYISENIKENISENISENAHESISESRNSTSDEKHTEKNKNENSSYEEDAVEECETPNEYSSDSEKNKVDCILNGCRSVKNYRKLNKISEGTYGTVFRAQNKKTKKIVALKQLKHFSSIQNEGFAITSLREINILLQLKHENILSIKEVVIGKNLNDIYLVMEYIEHELKILLDNKLPSFTISELKCLLKQLLSGINYLHTNWVMHRDLKPTNLLYSNRGILKICDFGMSRKFGHINIHNLTKNVVTLWYRAPELLLGEKFYTNKIDIWSVGCIFAEMILKKPLFIGDNEYEQIMKILSLLGLPDKESYPEFYEYTFISKNKDLFKKKKIKMNVNNIRSYFPNVANQFSGLYLSDNGIDLLQKLLHFNPKNRISAAEALNHPYFKEFPKPTEISEMPIIPDTNKVIRSSKMARHVNLLNQKNIQFHS
ncbi:cdc2-related protein kinase 1, putative [Plasmodium relictum]|uniref:Cyclin-dependent kinase 2 homolog n=1 Tax=Plasmodium relictum TaxID=85471 RepID=A0A1J1H2N8_PLARL|nr:cdc2-related protein kinase 1, putative [Plasmodium relictum]CRG98973.1 cdc2-related protein kinase 1, putative [Plasmodium relictum]